MAHRRFFVEPRHLCEGEAVFDGAYARQITKVLRLKRGDIITLLDGEGNTYSAELTTVTLVEVRARIVEVERCTSEPKLKLTLASCLPKGNRIDLIVGKCTELGISEILLVESERTVARPDAEATGKKLYRLRKIATEATEQCERSKAPTLRGIIRFSELVDMIGDFDTAVVAWEEEDGLSLKEALGRIAHSESMLVIIGPEGGLTEREVEALKSAGAVSVSLGPRLLRTDTAAIAVCAAVMYEIEGVL